MMSGIGLNSGVPNVGGVNIASSAAGTQRSGADTDRVLANAESARFRVDRDAQTNRSLGDVAEAENTPDRDADGRLLGDGSRSASRRRRAESDQAEHEEPSRAADPEGERGGNLDLDA